MIPYTYNSLVHAGKPEQGDGPFYIEGIETKTLVEKTGSKLRNIPMDDGLHKHTYHLLSVFLL